jgi:autoinducer 2-degrading protein
MPHHAIIVEVETNPGCEEQYLEIIREHARLTLQEEEGCLRFEIIKPIERDGTPIANKVMINELYTDEPAVARHEKNPRMPGLRERAKRLVASQRLILATVFDPT